MKSIYFNGYMSKVTPDVDGFSRKVWRWIKDVRVSPHPWGVWVGVIPLKGRRGTGFPVTLLKPKGWELD